MGDSLPLFFINESGFDHASFTGAADSPDDLFSILESLEDAEKEQLPPLSPFEENAFSPRGGGELLQLASQGPAPAAGGSSSINRPRDQIDEAARDQEEEAAARTRKKPKLSGSTTPAALAAEAATGSDGQQKVSHITVERNRRKQMNEHLSVLRSLMPCFYVKRGDQASIIGGVVEYIKELQQVLQSLEAKKQRKAYCEVLSPRPVVSSPRPSPLSPRPPPLSPRVGLPISPRTPQPGSPYKPRLQPVYLPPAAAMAPSHESSPSIESGAVAELAANSKSAVADVEVKFSGPNVLLKTASQRIPGQALKIISTLEGLSLEILHVSISTIEDTMLNSFTIKIGIECELSAEELAHEIQQTFS